MSTGRTAPRHPLPGFNRFPPGHPRNPDPVQRNSRYDSSPLRKIHLDPSSVGGGVPACSRTIYGPLEVWDNFHRDGKEDDIKRVLAKIQTIYHEVEVQLESSDILESGYCCCLGLLDPKANILVNGFISSNASSPASSKGGDVAQRSLDGLITFLTCLFPYLPDAEALAYLDAVDADPLAAAALIVARRGRKNYCWMEPTTAIAATTMGMALKCGAVAAKHPDPSLLVKGWTSLSHCLHQIARPLSAPRPDYRTRSFVLRNLRTNEHCNLKVQTAWELADDRLSAKLKLSDNNGGVVPTGLPPVRAAMKRMLLAKIHGFYLKALCSLPKDELTERYHRALVMGGYCYGPLQPAANIIVNMIWYEQTFPTAKRLKISMISTRFLWQLAARSLYGLVSFLCTRYPSLTPDLAVQRLLVAEANLQVADPNLYDATPSSNLKMDWSSCPQIGSGKDTVAIQMNAVRKSSASLLEAYTAAATAAFHPSPAAQKEFLGSPDSVEKLKHASDMFRLDDGHQLSNEEFDSLFMFLQRCPSSVGTLNNQQEPEPTVVGKSEYDELSRRVNSFWSLHDRVSRMVSAALEKFNATQESPYSLHVICGVNELVSGPKFCRQGRILPHFPFIYQYSHINFLATLDAQPPKLFFAQCNNDDYNDTWCVPADWSRSRSVGGQARCFYCETHGNRIIHPASSDFHGFDFEEAFFGPDHKHFYDNDNIIFFKSAFMEWVNGVEEEAIYLNYQLRGDDGNGDSSKHLRLAEWRPAPSACLAQD